jgi:aryl sulfotransferase
VTAGTVWLASYPKSGNTWLRAVLSAWLCDGPVDLARLVGQPIASSRAAFDSVIGMPSSRLTPGEIAVLRPRVDEAVAVAGHTRVRKVHDSYAAGPAGEPVVSTAVTHGAIYVVRDPRDVAVSYARARSWPLESAVAHLGDPRAEVASSPDRLHEQLPQRLGTWSAHVRSWTDETPFPVDVVRYEDFVAAPVETFGRALRFAGFDGGNDGRLRRAIAHASFDRLQADERARGFTERHPGEASFFRRGRPGAWRDELPSELAARIERDHGDVMARFGYG